MFARERVSRRRVRGEIERRRFEPACRVAPNAVAPVISARELIAVLIHMAIGTARTGDRNAEVGCLMTGPALQRPVTPIQWITCFAVIEVVQSENASCLPAVGVVALPACRLESISVRIAMAGHTIGEGNVFITGHCALRVGVAAFA
jgi:hypothetical protein